ncbi:DUF1697 domain-containing protein [Methylocapsa polymorpha]|uniref:DUF1697 domain-containing protein n=1 Tax=Methylocapsa polymorpha TaxID=3080828 RepID=A0ABZ0HQW2_9HYPH|nr:DUF1697 domain-containing protein [Methylocapsa sp. RX1]
MTVFVALLRAINVGGTGTLPMKELSVLCTDLGLDKVRTYIQSGNVVFESRLSEEGVRQALEQSLTERIGKRIDVVVRTASELLSVLEANPFPGAQPAKVAVVFLSDAAHKGLLDNLAIPGGEEVRAGKREIYIHYPNGMGRSKLKLPSSTGVVTVRNINTVAKLVAMATA